jgi:phosphatidylinositol glycan class B
MSSFYGLSSSHYYLSQAIPILLFTQLPFFLHGYWLSYCAKGRSITRGSESVLRYVIGGTVGVYSLLAHKEWRFIYPLLPILHLFSTISLVEGWEKYQISKSSSTPAEAISQGKGTTSKGLNIFDRILVTKLHLALITFSLIPAIYLTSFHSVGQIRVMEDLRTVPQMSINLDLSFESLGQLGRSLGVLMPCHSTPWMSHLHWDKEAEERSWFLECEPPVL